MLAVASAPAVDAAVSPAASGTFAAVISPIAVREADGNTFIDFVFVEHFTGTMSGERVGAGRLALHPDGSINVRVSGVLTGSIAGESGTVLLDASGRGTLASITLDWVVTHGAGDLAGVHAEGTAAGAATGPASFAGTYSGVVTATGS
jgi:hypothetical protein